jgi:hypothetical protein
MTGKPSLTRILAFPELPTGLNRGWGRVGDHADKAPDESDVRKGCLAGRLIFSDALPAEIIRAG